jgi:hypothetical protein
MLWRRKPKFVYPIPPAPRTALLSTVFRPQRMVRAFDVEKSGWKHAVGALEPQSLAGPIVSLEALAGLVQPTHAIIVLRSERDALLTTFERDRLWRAFRVPVFEQIVAADGTLLAAECEAHDGLHIVTGGFTLAGCEIDPTPCGCGKTEPRLLAATAARSHAVAAR